MADKNKTPRQISKTKAQQIILDYVFSSTFDPEFFVTGGVYSPEITEVIVYPAKCKEAYIFMRVHGNLTIDAPITPDKINEIIQRSFDIRAWGHDGQ